MLKGFYFLANKRVCQNFVLIISPGPLFSEADLILTYGDK